MLLNEYVFFPAVRTSCKLLRELCLWQDSRGGKTPQAVLPCVAHQGCCTALTEPMGSAAWEENTNGSQRKAALLEEPVGSAALPVLTLKALPLRGFARTLWRPRWGLGGWFLSSERCLTDVVTGGCDGKLCARGTVAGMCATGDAQQCHRLVYSSSESASLK